MMKCEICKKHIARHKHHINSRALGGNNNKYNLTHLCPNCHTDVHLGLIVIEGRFQTTNGNMLIWRYKQNNKIISGIEEPKVFTYQQTY